MRLLGVGLSASLALLLGACASEVDGARVALNDPLDLIDDVEGPLRLFVLPAESYACDELTGMVAPEVPDVAEGEVLDAVADISLPVMGSGARAEINLTPGDYLVLVRGKGTDPVTMRPNVFIATGCRSASIGAGETLEVRITLLAIVGMGECGDGVLSPDEQCEGGPFCEACRTQSFVVNSTMATMRAPSVGWARDQRMAFTFDAGNEMVRLRLLEADGTAVMTPSALTNDASLRDIVTGSLPGSQLLSSLSVARDGRLGLAWVDFNGDPSIRAGFFSANRAPQGPPEVIGPPRAGSPPRVTTAFAGDGSFLAVWEDAMSATGLSGARFAPGASTPSGAAFVVGGDATGASTPRAAGTNDGFVVAFTAGGSVFAARHSAEGSAMGENVPALDDAGGTQDQPAVAALSDGRFMLAWRDSGGDGSGSAIRARAFGADASPAGPALVANTTTAGDQRAPTLTAGNERFALAFESGSSVRARVFAATGDPVPNRESPPTTADFAVGEGSAPRAASGGAAAQPHFVVAFVRGNDIAARRFPLP